MLPQDNQAVLSVPWVAMLTSPPVWAILVTQCGQSWAFYTILTELPSYMANVLHFNIQQVPISSNPLPCHTVKLSVNFCIYVCDCWLYYIQSLVL